jgi:hypothetical protein
LDDGEGDLDLIQPGRVDRQVDEAGVVVRVAQPCDSGRRRGQAEPLSTIENTTAGRGAAVEVDQHGHVAP